MKKAVCTLLICAGIAGLSLSAFEPGDLLEYPEAIPDHRAVINAGIGFGRYFYGDTLKMPPLAVSMDYTLPLFGLPFFVGGQFESAVSTQKYPGFRAYWNYFSIGGRIGYHFNWGGDRLDTYAVTALGWTIVNASVEKPVPRRTPEITQYYANLDQLDETGAFFLEVSLGGRWFFVPAAALFAEAGGGFGGLSYITAGVTIKI